MAKITRSIFVCLFASAIGCSSGSNRGPASDTHQGDPVTVDSSGQVIVHDPNYVAPGLNVDQKDFGDDVLNQAKARLAEISKVTAGSTTIEEPDYALARLTLQTLISNALVNYFGTLENINVEVKAYLTKLAALRDVIAAKEAANDPRASIYRDALGQLMFRETPTVSASINRTYTDLLSGLYTLDGAFIVPMTRKKDQLKRNGSGHSIRANNSLFGVCQSYTCVKNLAADIQDWVTYVDEFNIEVKFENFDSHTIVRSSTKSTAPVVSRAVVDAANRLLDRALKDNKQYTLAGAIGAHVAQIVYRAPAGTLLTFASGAVYVFEKTIRFVDKVFASPVMQLNLSLQPVDAYKPSSIVSKLTSESEEAARSLPAVLYSNTAETAAAKARAEQAAAFFNVRLPVVTADEPVKGKEVSGYIISPDPITFKPGCVGLNLGDQVGGKRGRGTIRKIFTATHMAQIEYADHPGLFFTEVCEQFK